jgi:hypothetical protein
MKIMRSFSSVGTVIIVLAQGCAGLESPAPGETPGGASANPSTGGTTTSGVGGVGNSAGDFGDVVLTGGTCNGGIQPNAGAPDMGDVPNCRSAPATGGAPATGDAPATGGAPATVNYIDGRKFSCYPLPEGDPNGCAYPPSSCPTSGFDDGSDPRYLTLRFPVYCTVEMSGQNRYYPDEPWIAYCSGSSGNYRWACAM